MAKYYIIKDGHTVSDYDSYEEAFKHALEINGYIAHERKN